MKQKKMAVLNRFLMIIVSLVYFVLLVYFIFHYADVKSLYLCSDEIVLLMLLTVILSVFSMIPPTKKTSVTVFGKKITKSTKKKVRIINYIFESLYFAIAATTIVVVLVVFNKLFIDYYAIVPSNLILSIAISTVLLFVTSFILIFVLDYTLREKHIKNIQQDSIN